MPPAPRSPAPRSGRPTPAAGGPAAPVKPTQSRQARRPARRADSGAAAPRTSAATTATTGGSDFDRLLQAFATTHPHRPCHWNAETGELFAPPAGPRGDAAREAFELRLLEEEGWIEIPWQESDDAYAQARQFVTRLKPGNGRTALSKALDTPKPFRAFRAVLGKHPGLARRWEAEATAEALARMVECCVAHDVALDDPRFAAAREAWEAAQACSAPVVFEPAPVQPVRVALGALRLGTVRPMAAPTQGGGSSAAEPSEPEAP